jgi:hypothetical protein
VGVARARVLLQWGNPLHLDAGGQNALAQTGDLLGARQQARYYCLNRLIAHACRGVITTISQA